MKVAIYPGSFDPFTNGHLSIVQRASELFDKVFIVVSINNQKIRKYDTDKICKAIEKTLESRGITNCVVGPWDGLIADFMKQWNIKYLIRGLRNNMDYNYEENIAQINNLINPDIQTIYFRAKNNISSSMVNELFSFQKDISDYVPLEIFKLMTCEYINELSKEIKNEK